MSEVELATVIAIGGAITTMVVSLIKRFNPNLSSFWLNAVLLVISLLVVWGYQIYKVGFDQMVDDPIGTLLSMFAVTGFAVAVYEAIGKPLTISPRIEGTFEQGK